MGQEKANGAHGANRPWDLSRTPNYDKALPIEAIDASTLTHARLTELVNENRPALLRGAVSSWTSSRKWGDLSYVSGLFPQDLRVRPNSMPKYEVFGVGSSPREKIAAEQASLQATNRDEMSIGEFFRRAFDEDDNVLFWEMFGYEELSQKRLHPDLGSFPFLPKVPGAADRRNYFYPPWGAMFYKNSFSDWHYHAITEALMCQFVGAKETLLMAPDEETWERFERVFKNRLRYYDIDLREYPEFADVKLYRVTVQQGDALFIPCYWWHAVQPLDHKFGITAPFWWDSPARVRMNLRYPATWNFIRNLPRRRGANFLRFLPRLAVEATWAATVNAWRRTRG
jgi:hypothetical protein